MLVLTERTPNPHALKFLPNLRLTDGRAWTFVRGDPPPAPSDLASAILALTGVAQLFIAEDFLTVTREGPGVSWSSLRAEVILTLAEHLERGGPAVRAAAAAENLPTIDPVEREVREILALYVRAAVAGHGGQIVFDRFEPQTGVLWLRMEGACGGCPSSRLTLKATVEQIVRRYVPEVRRVEQIAAPAREETAPRLRRWAGDAAAAAGRTVFTHMGKILPRRG